MVEIKMDNIVTEAEAAIKDTEIYLSEIPVLTITNNTEYQSAGSHLKNVKNRLKTQQAQKLSITGPLTEAIGALNAMFAPTKEKLERIQSVLSLGIAKFETDEDLKVKKEQARLAELARVEMQKKTKALEARAEKAEEKGQIEKAEDLMELREDLHIKQTVAMPTYEKVKGLATTTVWKHEIKCFSKLDKKVYLENEGVKVAINKVYAAIAKATKGAIPMDGVRFFSEKSVRGCRS